MNRLTPGKQAQHTAKWARTMTRWFITYHQRGGARWNIVDFGGQTKAEARGIVDLMAVRKDHRSEKGAFKRGDLFEIVLIQTKGGSAPRPTLDDVARLSAVAKYYRAKAVVLVIWRRGEQLDFFKLKGTEWIEVENFEIFG